MKKVLGLSLAAMIIVATGCSKEQVLKCTMEQEQSGASTTSHMNVTFKGKEATKIDMDIEIKYDEKLEAFADTFKSTLESQQGKLEDTGYTVKITSGDNSVKLTASGTSKTLKESEYKGTYEATKEKFEDAGYTCK